VASCATSPPPSADLVVTVPALPTATRVILEASPTPARVETSVPTATPTAVIPTVTRATLEIPDPTATPTTVIPTVTCATLDASPTPATVETPGQTATPAASIPVCTARIVSVFPHDRAAYTQGLVYENGGFYEGTGLRGRSALRRVDLESGEVLQTHSLPPQYFGEGIAIWEDRIIQLTWQSRQGFVYDKESFELLDTFSYPTEGWGITHDGTELIMSDGTQTLRFWDPETLIETGSIDVFANAGPVTRINELEYIQGMVFANIWQTDLIAVIDPHTGQVAAWIDLRGLLGPEDLVEPVDVLNGIAYDAGSERLFVTGKLWPKVFEIELISPTGAPAPLTCR
jgi:glutamine cyclotransferase